MRRHLRTRNLLVTLATFAFGTAVASVLSPSPTHTNEAENVKPVSVSYRSLNCVSLGDRRFAHGERDYMIAELENDIRKAKNDLMKAWKRSDRSEEEYKKLIARLNRLELKLERYLREHPSREILKTRVDGTKLVHREVCREP